MTKTISAQALHDALCDGAEIALLDVREEGLVLCDGADGPAERAGGETSCAKIGRARRLGCRR